MTGRLYPDAHWTADALCGLLTRDGYMDPEAWTGDPDHPSRNGALEACRLCPVKAECADEMLATAGGSRTAARDLPGVWAGTDETARQGRKRTAA